MSALLRIEGLVKRFGGAPLFEIAELEITAGGAYVLTGVNGAGKSTLLRVLAGLEPAHCARLEFEGRPLPLKPYPRRLRDAVVYVHQHPAMFSTSVADNVGYGLAARGIGGARWRREVEAAMEWAG
ncbi:MAG: ATP-binding cassette domain-containing protein, partial [Burkholderiaceae bacterium]